MTSLKSSNEIKITRNKIAVLFTIGVLTIVIINPMSLTSDIDSLDRKITTTEFIAICAIVVTLIVAIFTFYFRGKQNDLLKLQREKDQVVIAEANSRSESAKKNAANASERAELAIKDAAIANEEAAKLNKKAAEAELRSKELEVELLRLRLAVGDRFLPPNIEEVLKSELKKYSTKKIEINCAISNTSEPFEFVKKLNNFFKDIGWTSKISVGNNVMTPSPTGIRIVGYGDSNKEIVTFICNQLNSLNYECTSAMEGKNKVDLFIQVWAH